MAWISRPRWSACTCAHADGNAAAQYKTGTLTVDISGPDASACNFAWPVTRGPQLTLTPAEVVARLKEATKLFVFPDKAKCQVENANAFTVDTQGRPTTAEGNIQAMYRFRCEGATTCLPCIDRSYAASGLSDQLPGPGEAQTPGSATDKGEIAKEAVARQTCDPTL